MFIKIVSANFLVNQDTRNQPCDILKKDVFKKTHICDRSLFCPQTQCIVPASSHLGVYGVLRSLQHWQKKRLPLMGLWKKPFLQKMLTSDLSAL